MPSITAIRKIKDQHQAAVICTACGHGAEIPDSYFNREPGDGNETDDECGPCPKCGEGGLMLVDATTANVVVTVYDALNESNKAKMASFSLLKMVGVAWKLIN